MTWTELFLFYALLEKCFQGITPCSYVDKLPDDFDECTYVMDLDECSAYFRDELGINTDATTMRQTAVDIMTRHYSTDIPAKDRECLN